MSQYPPAGQWPWPYPPPVAGGGPFADLLAPARRAGTLMMLLGALGLTCGFCFGISSLVPFDQLPAEQLEQLEQITAETGLSVRAMLIFSAVAAAAPSLAMLICGALTRKGGRAAAWTSLILVSLFAVLLAVRVGRSLIMAFGSPAPVQWLVDAATVGVVLALLVLLIVWLVQAVRRAEQLRRTMQQYQWQYWQYAAQQQQAYARWVAAQQQPPQPPPPPAQG